MRRVALGALCLVTISACTTWHTPRPPGVTGSAPLVAAEDLLRAEASRRDSVRGVRAFARLAYTSPEESHRVKDLILAERPDRLRIEVLSLFGPLFVVTASHGALAVYARRDDVVYRGAASPENLQRYANVGLPVSTAVDLLLGTPPMASNGHSVVSSDDGYIKLWQSAGSDIYVTWFTSMLEPVRYERRDDQGHLLVRATFGEYAAVSGVRLPTQLSVELPASSQRIDIELRDPEANPALADTVFALETPSGSKEINLDQVAN